MKAIPIIAAILLLIIPVSAGVVTNYTETFIPVYEADVYHANASWVNWTMMITNKTTATNTVTASSAARIIGLQTGTTVNSWGTGEGNFTRYYRMIYAFNLQSIPMNATITDGYLSINVSENSTKLGHTQIVFTRVLGHDTRGMNINNEKFTDATALSVTGYTQWLNVNGLGESNMTEGLEINKTPINKRWNFTLTAQGINEINNNTFRNTARYGNYTVFMGRLGWDAVNYTVNPTSFPEWHYNKDTKIQIYSYRLFDKNSTPMLVLNYSMVNDNMPPVAQFSVNLTPGPTGMIAQFFSQANNTIPGSTKYSWNFTDGGTKEDSDLENPTWTYSTAGTYTVRLTVTNPGSITDTMTKTNYIIVYTPAADEGCPPCCDNYTTSLLHYEGADHSVDIIDENTANTWMLRDVGEITTAQMKFGVSSLGLADAGGYAELTPSSADTFNLGKQNWTWDTWLRYDDVDPATDHGIFTMGAFGAGNDAAVFYQRNIAGTNKYVFNIYHGIVTVGSFAYDVHAGEYNVNQWYHLELSRNHTFINFSIDGDQKEWDSIAGAFDENTDMGNPGNMSIGYDSHDDYYLDGWVDETRFSLGTQRHAIDFAVPTEAYTWDPCTESGGGNCTLGYNVTSYFHDTQYVPVELEWIFIIIGFATLFASRILKEYQIMPAVVAPLAFLIAAWYANYMEQSTISGITIGENPFMIHTEVIIASPVLSVLMVVCFLISIINLAVIFLSIRKEPEPSEE